MLLPEADKVLEIYDSMGAIPVWGGYMGYRNGKLCGCPISMVAAHELGGAKQFVSMIQQNMLDTESGIPDISEAVIQSLLKVFPWATREKIGAFIAGFDSNEESTYYGDCIEAFDEGKRMRAGLQPTHWGGGYQDPMELDLEDILNSDHS